MLVSVVVWDERWGYMMLMIIIHHETQNFQFHTQMFLNIKQIKYIQYMLITGVSPSCAKLSYPAVICCCLYLPCYCNVKVCLQDFLCHYKALRHHLSQMGVISMQRASKVNKWHFPDLTVIAVPIPRGPVQRSTIMWRSIFFMDLPNLCTNQGNTTAESLL